MKQRKYIPVKETPLIKINLKFGITYVNESMLNMLEMDLTDIIGKKPKIVCHPDMPHAIHDSIATLITSFKTGYAILKHGTKEGNFFWTLTYFEPKYKKDGTFEAFITKRKPVPTKKLKKEKRNWEDYLLDFYAKLKSIEEKNGVDMSLRYLKGFLEEKGYGNLTGFYLDFFDMSPKELDFLFNINHQTSEKKIGKFYFPYR